MILAQIPWQRLSRKRDLGLTSFDLIQPGQEFRNGNIELGRDVLIEIDLRKQSHQFRGFMDEESVFAGTQDDLVGNQPFPFGNDRRGRITGGIFQGDRHVATVAIGILTMSFFTLHCCRVSARYQVALRPANPLA